MTDTVKKQAILLVEADILARHPLAEYLRECGYIVVEAASTDEAKVLATSSEPEFDVALIDAASVGDEGFTFAQWLRRQHPSIAISMTGNIEKITDQARKLCDESPSLKKPHDHQAILAHIKRLIALRQRMKDDV